MVGFFWLLVGAVIFIMFCYYWRGGGGSNRRGLMRAISRYMTSCVLKIIYDFCLRDKKRFLQLFL